MEQIYIAIKDNKIFIGKDFALKKILNYPKTDNIILELEKNGFVVDTLAHLYTNNIVKRKIKMDNLLFSSLPEAVEYCRSNYTNSSFNTVKSLIERNLSGKTKTAYKHTFSYQLEQYSIDLEKYEVIFL